MRDGLGFSHREQLVDELGELALLAVHERDEVGERVRGGGLRPRAEHLAHDGEPLAVGEAAAAEAADQLGDLRRLGAGALPELHARGEDERGEGAERGAEHLDDAVALLERAVRGDERACRVGDGERLRGEDTLGDLGGEAAGGHADGG